MVIPSAESTNDSARLQYHRLGRMPAGMFHGQHLVGSSSMTQNADASSAGESEHYRYVKTRSRLLGLQALACNFGRMLFAQVFVDSTACKGIAPRRGVGKIRHLHVQVSLGTRYTRFWVRRTQRSSAPSTLLGQRCTSAHVALAYDSSKFNRPSRYRLQFEPSCS